MAQEQVAAMQQNLRAGMLYLTRDLRHAGADLEGNTSHASCDAGGSGSAVSPGFHTATSTTIGFSMDLDEDGACDGTGENVTYNLYTSDGVQKLGRKSPSINAAIAEHIEEIEFYYTLSDGSQALTPTDLTAIRSVQVSLLARAGQRDPGFDNSSKRYCPGSHPTYDSVNEKCLDSSSGQKWNIICFP